ncbi:MAG: MFS transporter [Planctomycetes bacterium]|nr:MFS transporter [Planctomycetota bacterium]
MTAVPDRLLVWAIVGSQFGPPFLFAGVAVALPDMGRELGFSAVELGLVETTFLASATAFLLPAGRLVDAGDRRTVFRWSLMVFAVLAAAIACMQDIVSVLVLRLLQGAASALSGAAGPAILVDLVPAERRGRVFGAVIGTAYAGLSAGPFVAGWLVEHFGWRAVFGFGAALILACYLPVHLRMPSRWRRPERWVHVPSLVLLVAGVFGLVFGSAAIAHGPAAWLLTGLGAVLLVWFVVLQLHSDRPLLDLRELARNTVLARALVVQLLVYGNAYASIFLLSVFLQETRALPPREAGFVVAIGSVVMMCIAPFAGRLADAIRPQLLAAVGVAAVVVSSLLGMQLTEASGRGVVAAVLVAQGLGFGLFSTPNLALIMASMGSERSGMASALAAQSRGIGMFAGMALVAVLVALHFGTQPVAADPPRFARTLGTAYVVLAVTSALALLVALVGRPRGSAVPTR